MIELLGFIFICVGVAFDVFGCLGLIRLPDLYDRLQAATKCVTLGTCSILFGAALIMGFTSTSLKLILCIWFVLLTSPVAAHALARGAHRAGVRLWTGSLVDRYADDKEGTLAAAPRPASPGN
jgi:multicomponent Na+:H+ antiporter subunit G